MRGTICILLCAILQAAEPPSLTPTDIVNAADHSTGRVAPGEIVLLFPANAGPAILAGAQIDTAGRTTTLLADTRVWFDGIAAPMTFSVAGKLGAVVPYAIAGRQFTQVVVEYQGLRSAPVEVAVVPAVPALFTLDSTGKGQAGMLNERGCCNSPRNPAMRGSLVALYATGAGQTLPAGVDGSVPATSRLADYPRPALPVRVTVGGRPAKILYAAAAPHAVAGLLQVNIRVPDDAPIGDAIPLVLTVGDAHSSGAVTMAVRSARYQVLLTDSNRAQRMRLKSLLTAAGYDVAVATNSRRAQSYAADHPIDLVICALTLPDADRNESMQAILATRPQPKLAAIAATLGPRTLRIADLMGAQAVITTSLSREAILRRIRDLLRSSPVPYSLEEMPPTFPRTSERP